jgi:hypothetical protein
VIAVRGCREPAAHFRLKVMLAHETANLLVIDDPALLPKSGSDAAPAMVLAVVFAIKRAASCRDCPRTQNKRWEK